MSNRCGIHVLLAGAEPERRLRTKDDPEAFGRDGEQHDGRHRRAELQLPPQPVAREDL